MLQLFFLGLSLSLATPETPRSLAARVLDELGVPALEMGEAVQVQLEGSPRGVAVARRLAELLRGLGIPSTHSSSNFEEAVEAGYEWRLELVVEVSEAKVSVQARWVELDRGLWKRPSHAPRSSVEIESQHFLFEPVNERFGRAQRMFTWPRPVWAIRRCRNRWVVVDEISVSTRTTAGAVSSYDLRTKEAAELPVRAPWATVWCRDSSFAIGHGRLQLGWLFQAEPLRAVLPLEGQPVGVSKEGRWVTTTLEDGLPLFRRVSTPSRVFETSLALRQAVWSPEQSWVVDRDGQLRSMSPTGRLGAATGRVGFGLSAAPELVVSTSPAPDQGQQDTLVVYLVGTGFEALSVRGRVTAVSAEGSSLVWAATEEGESSVWMLELSPKRELSSP